MDEIRRVWRGEKSLLVTFWIWYFFGVGFLLGTVGLIAVVLANSLALFIVWFFVYAVYYVFALVAVWRSSSRYKGLATWKWLARGFCLLGVLRLGFFHP